MKDLTPVRGVDHEENVRDLVQKMADKEEHLPDMTTYAESVVNAIGPAGDSRTSACGEHFLSFVLVNRTDTVPEVHIGPKLIYTREENVISGFKHLFKEWIDSYVCFASGVTLEGTKGNCPHFEGGNAVRKPVTLYWRRTPYLLRWEDTGREMGGVGFDKPIPMISLRTRLYIQ